MKEKAPAFEGSPNDPEVSQQQRERFLTIASAAREILETRDWSGTARTGLQNLVSLERDMKVGKLDYKEDLVKALEGDYGGEHFEPILQQLDPSGEESSFLSSIRGAIEQLVADLKG